MYDLEYEDLIKFIEAYNRYVQDFNEEHDSGYPVSCYEFFDYEYQEILKEEL